MKSQQITLQNNKSDLKKLVMLMNKQNKRFFPPFKSILNSLDFSLADNELELLLRLGTDTYTYDHAADSSGMRRDTFNGIFESLKNKGFIGTTYTESGDEVYSLHPFIVGWFEAQVSFLIGSPEEKEFARRWMDFFNGLRRYNFFPLRNLMNMMARKADVTNQSVGLVRESKNERGKSIININQSLSVPDSKVYPTNSVIDLIHEYGTKSVIGQFTCMCRRITANLDEPCRLAMPDDGGCLGFGDKVKPYIKAGHARPISKEKAFEVIQKVRDRGAIHTVFHEKDDTRLPSTGICNCCWDCCGILRSYNMGAAPLRYSSFYIAKFTDRNKCTGCKKCEKACPTAAITVSDKKASINEALCIGCGQCVHQCSASAVELADNVRTAFLPMLKKSDARITV